MCKETAHDRVAHVQGERGAEECRAVEVRRDEPETAQVCERRGEGHQPARAEDGTILKTLERLAGELLSNHQVADTVSWGLMKAFEAKARMDRVIQIMLALMNLPSRGDLNRIVTKLEALQGSLVNLNLKVDRLLSGRPPGARGERRKPASAAADDTSE